LPRVQRLLYAHRGASAELPENTIAAFRRGLERGANALETDVHMTRDGHVVVSHDPSGGRMAAAPTPIRHSTLAEVRRWDAGWGFIDASGKRPFAGTGLGIPTLEEVLEEFPDTPINVDVKQRHPTMIDPLLALLRRMRVEARVRLASFETATVREIRRRGYPGPTGLGQTEVIALVMLPLAALRLLAVREGAVQIPPRAARIDLATQGFVTKCHALGLRVDYWVVDDPAEARRLLELGADGIMTDDPGRIAPVFTACAGGGATRR